VNMALLSTSERKAEERNRKAALWAHKVKTGKISRGQVFAFIDTLKTEEQKQDMRARYERYESMGQQWT